MMHDRFDAQLREHLLGTADSSPADGQLAAVVQGVARTPQRRPLAARLTWYPGRIGPFTTRTVRLGIAVALIAAIVAAALYVGSNPSRSSVFEGTWVTMDPADGSTELLVVGTGTTPAVRFVDQLATGLACRPDAIKVFTADGKGKIDGKRLHASFPNGGGCQSMVVAVGPLEFTFDEATDTIVDGDGLTWSRAAGGEALPSPGAVQTSTPATPAATSELRACTDLQPGQAYRVEVGSRSVTMNIPIAPNVPWGGLNDKFHLVASCENGGTAVTIDATIVGQIPHDSCRDSGGAPITGWEDAVGRFEAQLGHTTDAVAGAAATINGYRVRTYALAEGPGTCTDGLMLWNDTVLFGTGGLAYLVDVDGVTFGIKVEWWAPPTADQLADIEAIVATMRVGAEVPTETAPGSPQPTSSTVCVEFDGSGTYTAPIADNLVVATLPDQAGTTWSGLTKRFALFRAPCKLGSPLTFEASTIANVATDACAWTGGGTDVTDAASAAQALERQAGIDVTGRRDLTIDGNAAVEVHVSVPPASDAAPCDEGIRSLWIDGDGTTTSYGPGASVILYLIDFNGTVTAIAAQFAPGDELSDPDLRSQIDAIIGSLEIKVAGGASS